LKVYIFSILVKLWLPRFQIIEFSDYSYEKRISISCLHGTFIVVFNSHLLTFSSNARFFAFELDPDNFCTTQMNTRDISNFELVDVAVTSNKFERNLYN